MEVCDVCGTSFDTDGYFVVADGRRYDSIECALRAQERTRRRSDATSAWISSARRRLGIVDDAYPADSDQKSV